MLFSDLLNFLSTICLDYLTYGLSTLASRLRHQRVRRPPCVLPPVDGDLSGARISVVIAALNEVDGIGPAVATAMAPADPS